MTQETFQRASEENGGPGGAYWEIKFCNFLIMESADLEDVWEMKGYLLKVYTMRKYSLWLYVKSAARSCHRESGTSWGACLLGLMLGTGLAMINIICNVSIYTGPVYGSLGEVSHLLYASVVIMQVTEHPLIQLMRYAHSVSL